MTIRHIRIFIAVYRTLNMTRAAEELHMAQPAVTRAVQEMERYYGVRLFERLGRRLTATECARELYGYALHIDDTFAVMERRLLNWDAAGVLRVGATIAIGNYELPRIARRFQSENPDVRLRARVAGASALIRALMADEVDLALIEGGTLPADIVTQPFGGDRLALIVPPDSPLPAHAALDEVIRQPLLLREPGSAGRAAFDRLLQEHGLTVEPAWESVSTQALVRAVAAGLGVAVLPDALVRGDIAAGNVRECVIDGVRMERTYVIARHKHKYLTPCARRFMEICRASAQTDGAEYASDAE